MNREFCGTTEWVTTTLVKIFNWLPLDYMNCGQLLKYSRDQSISIIFNKFSNESVSVIMIGWNHYFSKSLVSHFSVKNAFSLNPVLGNLFAFSFQIMKLLRIECLILSVYWSINVRWRVTNCVNLRSEAEQVYA